MKMTELGQRRVRSTDKKLTRDALFGRKKKSGVDRGCVEVHPEMQMGPGDAPGDPDFADLLTCPDPFAQFDVGLAEMHVHSDEAPAMVDHHRTAREKIVGNVDDFSGRRSDNRRTHYRGDIRAVVRTAWLSVQESHHAEGVGANPLAGLGQEQ